jgi:hypothetical protein
MDETGGDETSIEEQGHPMTMVQHDGSSLQSIVGMVTSHCQSNSQGTKRVNPTEEFSPARKQDGGEMLNISQLI